MAEARSSYIALNLCLFSFLLTRANILTFFLFIDYVYECFGWMYVCEAHHAWKPKKASELGTGVTDSPKLLRRYWELNLGPLGEQPLTTAPTKSLMCILCSMLMYWLNYGRKWKTKKPTNQSTRQRWSILQWRGKKMNSWWGDGSVDRVLAHKHKGVSLDPQHWHKS